MVTEAQLEYGPLPPRLIAAIETSYVLSLRKPLIELACQLLTLPI